MTAELISVGTEILLGQIVDTNAAFLAQRLADMGIGLYRKVVVGDNAERLAAAIRDALSRVDLVVLGGGLGPTPDDLTRETVADVMGVRLVHDTDSEQRLRAYFAQRDMRLPEMNLKQALAFEGGTVFRNEHGTAPGLGLHKDGKTVVCLPGPPHELKPMVMEQVLPYLDALMETGHPVLISRILKFCGIGESLVAERVADLLEQENPTVAPYAKMGEVHLRLTARARSAHEANAMLDPVDREITARLGDYLLGRDDETLEGVVLALLRARGWTLGGAESCTGGRVGDYLTSVNGASDVFMGSAVTYSNRAKQDILGVSAQTLATVGAVSEETAREMAAGARRAFHAEAGFGVTGIAGPSGGTEAKPVGTVWIAVETPNGVYTDRRLFRGGRDAIKRFSTQAVLTMLRTALKEAA